MDGNWGTGQRSTNGSWLYLSEDTMIVEGMIIKANANIFTANIIKT